MWCKEKIICGELDIIFFFHKFTTVYLFTKIYCNTIGNSKR